jgi:hypothetical protein
MKHMTWTQIIVQGFLLLWLGQEECHAFHHKACTWSRSSQFSFPDCYVPSMNPNMFLSEASFVTSHDAATGYLSSSRGISGATNLYAKNQIGSVYQQLEDGARALDIRPKLLRNGTVLCHHGVITIPVSLQTVVQDALQWVHENTDELVLILHHNFRVDSGMSWDDDDTAVNALSPIYESLGVAYVSCDDLYGLTVAETMALAQIASGGYLLAVDRHDAYASSCAKLNYVADKIVTCYPSNNNNKKNNLPCTQPKSRALEDLQQYALASANNDPTDNNYELGPPASWDHYPFNAIQALWQVDTHAATAGVAHFSSIIDDNTKSQLNAHVVDWVYQGEFHAISLLFIDHVQLNGNALLSVVRNTCGQSELDEACGTAIPKPKLRQKHLSTLYCLVALSIYLSFGVWLTCMIRHYRKYYNHVTEMARLQRDIQQADESFQRVVQGEFPCGSTTLS